MNQGTVEVTAPGAPVEGAQPTGPYVSVVKSVMEYPTGPVSLLNFTINNPADPVPGPGV
jgi:hypothetical protein